MKRNALAPKARALGIRAARVLGLAALVAAPLPGRAASPASAEPDPALIAAARKEGSVVWYTVQIVDELAAPIARAFQKKYGIKVQFIRANSHEIVLRVQNEARAGKIHADVVDGDSTAPALKRAGLLLHWLPDVGPGFPAERKDPEGFWIATYISVSTPDINTDLIPAADRPKGWSDLLDPRWKGKIAWSSGPSPLAGQGFIGLALKQFGDQKGMEYLRAFAAQKPVGLAEASTQVLHEVISGEYAIGLQISNHHAWFSAAQGAPVAWLPFDPAMVTAITASALAGAPHPAAAKLFLDFLVSKEGQDIFAKGGYLPSNPAAKPEDPSLEPDGSRFHGIFFSPEETERDMPKWQKIYGDLFR